MSLTLWLSLIFFGLSIFGLAAVFCIYPLSVWVISLVDTKPEAAGDDFEPMVSLVVVLRNGEAIVRQKVENAIALEYPKDKLEILFFSDGSTDQTEAIINEYSESGVALFSSAEHIGKAPGINMVVKHSHGEILVLSDADGILDPQSIRNLVKHYADHDIGGVCGQRVIYKGDDISAIKESQQDYIKFDSKIKQLESRIGNITSNDGKLYSIRKRYFKPISPDVTDDLFSCLSVIEQGGRFVFEPAAKAFIRTPSRNPLHEIQRRRRIVARSLRGIYYKRALLNPFRTGFFAFGLFINKVVRRLLPLCLLVLFTTSALLAMQSPFVLVFWLLQVTFYLMVPVYILLEKLKVNIPIIGKIVALVFYFCVGMTGTLLGFIDFVRLKRYEKWNPKKTG